MSAPDKNRGPTPAGRTPSTARHHSVQVKRHLSRPDPVRGGDAATGAAPDIHALADVALDTGKLQTTGELVLVPDVIAAAAIADNHPMPDTWRLRRGDGREVLVYRCPDQGES